MDTPPKNPMQDVWAELAEALAGVTEEFRLMRLQRAAERPLIEFEGPGHERNTRLDDMRYTHTTTLAD